MQDFLDIAKTRDQPNWPSLQDWAMVAQFLEEGQGVVANLAADKAGLFQGDFLWGAAGAGDGVELVQDGGAGLGWR